MGGLEEDRRVEAIRLLKLAGDRLDEAYNEMLKWEATRHDWRIVKAASMSCAACLTILRVPNSEMHWINDSQSRSPLGDRIFHIFFI
jgi:hypothetical protein